MARKLKFRRKSGMHRHKHKTGRQRTYRKGDIIKIDHISELGNTLDLWEEIEEKEERDPEIRVIKRRKEKEEYTTLVEKAVDGVYTKDFVRDVDLIVSGTLRKTWLDPKTNKVYWLSEDGYLSPMNEDDSPPRDGSGDIIDKIESDDPPLGLVAVHTGDDWYDVINEKTGEVINDKMLRLYEAEALIDGKIVEGPGNMAKE